MIDIKKMNIPQALVDKVPVFIVARLTNDALNGLKIQYLSRGEIKLRSRRNLLAREQTGRQ